jgi:hypothetical protein
MLRGSRASVSREERAKNRESLILEVTEAQSQFFPELLNVVDSRRYEQVYSQAQARSISASDAKALSALEEEFQIPPHTLSKFINWKKRQPRELPYNSKTIAERKAASRLKELKSQAALDKSREDLHIEQYNAALQRKQAAADVIKRRYEFNRDAMISEAARCSIDRVNSLPEGKRSLENAAKLVTLFAFPFCIVI